MLPKINKDLLPMKGHYLFFNGATAPVIPFLPIIARHLGFSGTTVGLVYTILPIVAMIAKPMFGVVADKFQSKKKMFILLEIVTAASLFFINFVPAMPTESKLHFSCDNGAAVLDSKVLNMKVKDSCFTQRISSDTESDILNCEVLCNVEESNAFETVCNYWGVPSYCNTSKSNPLTFKAQIPVKKITSDEFLIMPVKNITVNNKQTKATCPDSNHTVSGLCRIHCNSPTLNSMISKLKDEQPTHAYQFWLFLLLAMLAWVGMAVVVSVGDAICFEILGDNPSLYGYQRLWGSVGWGIFSIIAGLIVDANSKSGAEKDYTPVFYLMLAVMVVDVLVSFKLKCGNSMRSTSIVRDVGKLLGSVRIVVFLIWCTFMGACTGLLWQFLFWHLEDVATAASGGDRCATLSWIKTLEGLVMGIQCLGGELPFFFLSGRLIMWLGHVHCMNLVLFGVGIRYLLYYFLVDPWWVLPIELMNGITFGLFYATMASYASIAAPPGTEATVQGLVGAVFEGVGVSLGSLIGGIMFDAYGGARTFRTFGIASLICCLIHFLVQLLLSKKKRTAKELGLVSTSGRTDTPYMEPTEASRILDVEVQEASLVDD